MTPRHYLVFEVHLHDRRYHGRPEWPPAPARLFQALVAGAARGPALGDELRQAFLRLERLDPPLVAAPRQREGRDLRTYVPNNDLDAKGGHPSRISEIRVAKSVRPRLLDDPPFFLYAWSLPSEFPGLDSLIGAAHRLHAFGRGVDMAWATARVASAVDLAACLNAYPGEVFRPGGVGRTDARRIECPQAGSLESLESRYQALGSRFEDLRVGNGLRVNFRQPPRARFRAVVYQAPPRRFFFELRNLEDEGRFAPWPHRRTGALCEWVRDAAAARLEQTYEADPSALVERALVGRKVEGLPSLGPASRVRILPLPSIGHPNANPAVRRVVIEVPSACPLRADDVSWAIEGLEDAERVLLRARADRMHEHYGFGRPCRTWRTVTPIALPLPASERRKSVRTGDERCRRGDEGVRALGRSLRHAGVDAALVEAEIRQEPFWDGGLAAREFATGTRFDPKSLWHAEFTLSRAVEGPLVLGNGRFLGLGLCAPLVRFRRAFSFRVVEGWSRGADPLRIARALRRAVMARAAQVLGRTHLPSWISGHRRDGNPAEGHRHLHFVCDPEHRRLHVILPGAPDDWRDGDLEVLERSLAGFWELLAGPDGRLRLEECPPDDALSARSAEWRTATPYAVRRHARLGDPRAALARDAVLAAVDRGFPAPEVRVLTVEARRPGRPLSGHLALSFPRPIPGPVLLGRTAHQGGGYFRAVGGRSEA